MPAAGDSKRDNCAELKPQLTRSTSPQAEAGVEGAETEAEAEEEEEEERERRDGGREEAGTNTEEKEEEEESIGTDWLSKEEEDCSCMV